MLLQSTVSQHAGISPQYLSDIENDRRDPPSDSILAALAVVLAVHPDVIYHMAGRWPPDLRGVDVPLERLERALCDFRAVLQEINS